MVSTKTNRQKRQSKTANGYEKAICPGCGTILVGSREPGDRDHCVEAERDVTLQPVHKNYNACEPLPWDAPYDFAPQHLHLRGAIKRHREGERVPVEIPVSRDGVAP